MKMNMRFLNLIPLVEWLYVEPHYIVCHFFLYEESLCFDASDLKHNRINGNELCASYFCHFWHII